jgi:HPt (histidine-containing phosphotransfer) domain-containing protein
MKRPSATVDANLLVAYRQMLQDETREAEAWDWIEELIEDAASASRGTNPSSC